MHNSSAFQHSQMFRNSLPGQRRIEGKLRDRNLVTAAEFREESKSRLISQRREDGSLPLSAVSFGLMRTSGRHKLLYSASAAPNLDRSSSTLPNGARH